MTGGKRYTRIEKEEIEVGLALLFIAIGLGIFYAASQYYNAPSAGLPHGITGITSAGGPIGTIGTTTVGQNSSRAQAGSVGNIYIIYSGLGYVSAIGGNMSARTIRLPLGTYTSGLNGTYDNQSGYTYVASSKGTLLLLKDGGYSGSVAMPENGASIYGMVYNPSNGYLYVESSGASYCGIVIVQGASVVDSVKLPACASGPMAYDPGNGYIYAGTLSSLLGYNYMVAINGTSVAGWTTIDGAPDSMAYDSHNGYIYSLNVSSGRIAIINGTRLIDQVSMPGAEYLVYSPSTGYVYAPVYVGSSKDFVAVINNTKPFTNIAIGSHVYSMQYNPGDGNVYVYYAYNGNIGVSQIRSTTISSSVGLSGVGANGTVGRAYGYNPSTGITYLYAAGGEGYHIIALRGTDYLGSYKLSPVNGTIVCFAINCIGNATFGYNPLRGYTYVSWGDSLYVINGTAVIGSAQLGGSANMVFGS